MCYNRFTFRGVTTINFHTERTRKYSQAHPEAYILSRAKSQARRSGKTFSIDITDIVIPEFCPILGVKLDPVKSAKRDYVPSLDRVNNDLGYVKGNVRVISYKANVWKNAMPITAIERLLEYVRQHL